MIILVTHTKLTLLPYLMEELLISPQTFTVLSYTGILWKINISEWQKMCKCTSEEKKGKYNLVLSFKKTVSFYSISKWHLSSCPKTAKSLIWADSW